MDEAAPDEFVFITGTEVVPGRLGEEREFGERAQLVKSFFTRPKAAVEQDWRTVVGLLRDLAAEMSATAGEFAMQEAEFQLGFSAKGKLGFIAEAGVTTSVKVKFVRRDPAGNA
ncbi:hypothetical protein AB0J55_01825 [Amycolatopsis sp. NPDC049688]|uniref:Pepco domain-containing protein n=1 Tax=Amycolatopsis sp. NPDC049688 TaxID=3154733 RepID=UPI00341CA21A